MSSEIKVIRQHIIEDTYARHNIRKKVRKEMEATPEVLELLDKTTSTVIDWAKVNSKMGYSSKIARMQNLLTEEIEVKDIIFEIFLEVSLQQSGSYQSIAGKVANYLTKGNIFYRVKTIAEIMAIMCRLDCFNVKLAKDTELGIMMVNAIYKLPDELIQYIHDTMYLPPMIVKPKKVISNYCNPTMTRTESLILGPANHHEYELAYDAVNLANSIPLSLDLNILEETEKPNKKITTLEQLKAFSLLRTSSRKVYDLMLENDNIFYLYWKYDKRGRMYSQGYHVNIQSTDYKKALINFAREEPLDD